MRKIDQRACPHCGDEQWMRLEVGRDVDGGQEFRLRCPACRCILVIPELAVDWNARLVHLVRPEAVARHTYAFKGPVCWCRPRVLLDMALDGYNVILHTDEEELQ